MAGSSKPITVPAPVRGINVYDPIVAMENTYALLMQNMWPQPYGCSMRKGYVEWATGLGAAVQTLAVWSGPTGNYRLFAWAGSKMFDITARGAATAPIATGLSNATWEYICLTNSAGSRMIAVNGFDSAITYTQSGGIERIIAGDGSAYNTWAGINPQNVSQLCLHQRRLWAVKKNSTEAWYLPPDAYQGTFVKFDFGPLFSKGGYLQFLASWTIDDGSSATDHLIAVSSNGEAAVYSGTDPSNASTWGLSGVYFIGPVVAGTRAHSKASGDHLILTQRGLVSMAEEIGSTRVNQQQNPLTTVKIQALVSELVNSYSINVGWEVNYYQAINMVMINIPTLSGNIQLVANQITNAWSQFVDMDAACWDEVNSIPYFGDYTGRVYQAWTGFSDKVLLDNSGGSGVRATVQQAYNYFGGMANQKQVVMYRPTFVVSGQMSMKSTIAYDFKETDVTYPAGSITPGSSLWNTAQWGKDIWFGGSLVNQSWQSAEGMGVAASLKMTMVANCEVLWVATDYVVNQGSGVL